jgi:hypothetical protein
MTMMMIATMIVTTMTMEIVMNAMTIKMRTRAMAMIVTMTMTRMTQLKWKNLKKRWNVSIIFQCFEIAVESLPPDENDTATDEGIWNGFPDEQTKRDFCPQENLNNDNNKCHCNCNDNRNDNDDINNNVNNDEDRKTKTSPNTQQQQIEKNKDNNNKIDKQINKNNCSNKNGKKRARRGALWNLHLSKDSIGISNVNDKDNSQPTMATKIT